jgi:hypothetical protein
LNQAAWMVPVLVAAVGFAAFCMVDVARAEEVRYLPRWAWEIVCLWTPWGGIIYLATGKVRTSKPQPHRSRIESSWPMWNSAESKPGHWKRYMPN